MASIVALPSIKPSSACRRQGLRKLSPDLISKASNETARQVTRIGLTFLGTTAFCLLSLLSPDSALLGGSEKISVPLAGPVSFFGFMLLGPAVLIALRAYLQIYVDHSDRLNRLARSVPLTRAPTLVPLKNPLLRVVSALTFYVLLPVAMMLFAWKAAVFPAWGSALGGVAVAVIASHVMLPLIRFSWPQRALASAAAGILAVGVMLGLNHPLHRPFNLFRANLSGQWLPEVDLRKANLYSANLSGANLSSADLSEGDLRLAKLNKAMVNGANLRGANLGAADLSEAGLRFAKLNKAMVHYADLSGADLSGADLSEATGLRGAKLNKATVFGANLIGADLSGADLSEADLRSAQLNNAMMSRANLSGADLSGANLSGADLSEANLSGAKLHEAMVNGANLSNAHLVKADLFGANLFKADLIKANLSTANLSGAWLNGADLSGASLMFAILDKAHVIGANLIGADLNHAFLNGADLSQADLRGADLSDAQNLTKTQLDQACGNSDTKLPTGLTLKQCSQH
jgi:uncharacterized protein YjbI with pentapeptide repeats